MPDIDMDFDDEHLQDVLQHVRDVYGEDHVCKVITYSTIKAKQAINDANRVLGFPVYMGQKLSKMLSNDPKLQLPTPSTRTRKSPTSTRRTSRRPTTRTRTPTASSTPPSPSRATCAARASTPAQRSSRPRL
jgi:DNA polymerase III alpha subunit